MVEIPLVCGKWICANKCWEFVVNKERGCRVLCVSRRFSYKEFVEIVYEDFGLDRSVAEVCLSYKLRTISGSFSVPQDTSPVFVCNGRQFQGSIRQCNSKSVRRLCVEIKDLESNNPKTGDSRKKEDMDIDNYYKEKPAGKKNQWTSLGDEENGLPTKFGVDELEDEEQEELKVETKEESGAFSIAKSNCSIVANIFQQIDFNDVDIAVGDTFESRKFLEIRLKVLSVVQKFDFIVDRSRPNLYVVKCWVRLLTERSGRARKAIPDVLGELYKEFVGGVGTGVVPSHVEAALNLRYGVKMDYWKGHRTLRCARELVRGSFKNGYKDLPTYLYMIRRANPGTLTKLEVDELDRFKSVFIAFGASIEGFAFMRKVIVVDENDESWEWIFRQLSRLIPDDEGLSIISDRHKSIGKAIGKVYLLCSRGICTYHLHKNIMLRFRGSETFGLVKKAETAYRQQEFNLLFQQIEALNPELHIYLQRADVSKWSRAHFEGDRYNFTTTNIAESINNVLRAARKFLVIHLLDEIRLLLTRWFAARRKQAYLMKTVLTEGVEELLVGCVLRASVLVVQEIDPNKYEVRSESSMHIVNLSQKKCSFRMFDIDKLPCIHAIAVATKANVSTISKCHPYFYTEYLRHGYAKSVMPMDGSFPIHDVVVEKKCNPPFVRTPSGRPKMSRAKCPLEVAMDRKKPRKVHCCSNCGHVGHNRKTCNA